MPNGLLRAARGSGNQEAAVGADGNRTRDQSGAHDSACRVGSLAKQSGTALIYFEEVYWRLRNKRSWDAFFIAADAAGSPERGEGKGLSGTGEMHVERRTL